MADRMVFFRTTTSGGAGGSVDVIDGDDRGDTNPLQDGDAAIVLTDAGYYYLYILDDDLAGAEDLPNIIAPDTNAGDKRWVLKSSPYILSGTTATAPSATGVPDGAIYFKYTP
jgi:hypothetical protein